VSFDFDSARLPNPHITAEHEAWRHAAAALHRYGDRTLREDWDEAGDIPDALWPKAAAVGLLGLGYPEAYGGTSEGIDSWHQWITNEELNRFAVGGVPASADGARHRFAAGAQLGARGHEAGGGAAGAGRREAHLPGHHGARWRFGRRQPSTTAVRDGDHFVVNGSKTYITGGMRADWVSTAVRTGGEGAGGVSMLLIPTDAEGFPARRWTASRAGGPRIRPPCISITCGCPWKT
jgi:acyl-CoA dehydrogenase